jgi:predicted porin
MKIKCLFLLIILLLTFSVQSDTTVYGKLFITLESQEMITGTELNTKSNASRLGIKGSIELKRELEVIYQAEYEVDSVDGTAEESNRQTFKQRNTFVGIKGSLGTLFLGTHDTAFRKSQNTIDLFNDLASDIKNILEGENRLSELVGFTTPEFGKYFSATFNVIKEKDGPDDASSFSLKYKTTNIYAALALDSKVEGYDSYRVSFQIPLNKAKLGLMFQTSKEVNTGDKEEGYVVSLSRKITNKGTIKLQLAESDIKLVSGKQTSFGYDQEISKRAKIFIFYTDLSSPKVGKERNITAVGFELKF